MQGYWETILKLSFKIHCFHFIPRVFGCVIESAWQRRRHKRRRFKSWVGKIPWRRKRQPTPVLLPGKSHGRRSLAGYSPWGREELDTTDVTSLSLFTFMHWRRKCQPTPVFLPGESQGQDPGGLPSMGSHRVGHNSRDLAAAKLLINGAYSMRMCSGFTMLCYFLLYSKVNWLRMCVCVYISPLFWISFPFRSPQSSENSSLCYTDGSY